MVRADYADRTWAVAGQNFLEFGGNQIKSLLPGGGNKLAITLDQRLLQALGIVGKVESVAAFYAKKVAVDAAFVAIVTADDLHAGIGATHPQSGFAAVSAMGADGADVLHLPGACLVTISARGQCPDRTDVDAHAALFALQMIFLIGRDDRSRSAILDAERPYIHPFTAHPNAAIAENAARTIEVDHRRPLLLVAMVLHVHELRFGCAILEGHVLQFALATGVADRAIERMIGQQHLDHRLASLLDLVALGSGHHALSDRSGACGLQLGHLLDFDQAHAAGALQRQARVVAERRHLDARALASFDKQRPRGNGEFLAVDSKGYISHKNRYPPHKAASHRPSANN